MKQDYPLPAFHFIVKMDSFPNDVAFSSVQGLNIAFTHDEHESKKTIKRENGILVLKRALSANASELSQWIEDTFASQKFKPIDLQVVLLDANHEPSVTWKIIDAIPCKYSISPFDSMNNSYVEEIIEFEYSFFKRVV